MGRGHGVRRRKRDRSFPAAPARTRPGPCRPWQSALERQKSLPRRRASGSNPEKKERQDRQRQSKTRRYRIHMVYTSLHRREDSNGMRNLQRARILIWLDGRLPAWANWRRPRARSALPGRGSVPRTGTTRRESPARWTGRSTEYVRPMLLYYRPRRHCRGDGDHRRGRVAASGTLMMSYEEWDVRQASEPDGIARFVLKSAPPMSTRMPAAARGRKGCVHHRVRSRPERA